MLLVADTLTGSKSGLSCMELCTLYADLVQFQLLSPSHILIGPPIIWSTVIPAQLGWAPAHMHFYMLATVVYPERMLY